MHERAKSKPVVITLHGIRTDGNWQEQIDSLLTPHYHHIAFKYEEFRGPLTALIWLGLELIGSFLGLFAALSILIFSPTTSLSFRLLLATVIGIAVWLPSRLVAQRRRAIVESKFKHFWSNELGQSLPACAIAHSYGTYLLGSALRKFPEVRFKRAILCGCVLSRSFDWTRVVGSSYPRVQSIHNEVAQRDLVSRLALLLQGFVPSMGHSGLRGFREGPLTQTWRDPRQISWGSCAEGCTCKQYRKTSSRRFVHNALYRDLGHSDVFLGRSHALTFWLPYLWGISPGLYESFRDVCLKCALAEREANWTSLRGLEKLLSESCWGWTNGPLLNRIEFVLIEELARKGIPSANHELVQKLAAISVKELWGRLDRALSPDAITSEARLLEPHYALMAVVRAVVNGYLDARTEQV